MINEREEGFLTTGLDFSPVTGPMGNIEYLLALRYAPACSDTEDTTQEEETIRIGRVVERAHAQFD